MRASAACCVCVCARALCVYARVLCVCVCARELHMARPVARLLLASGRMRGLAAPPTTIPLLVCPSPQKDMVDSKHFKPYVSNELNNLLLNVICPAK